MSWKGARAVLVDNSAATGSNLPTTANFCKRIEYMKIKIYKCVHNFIRKILDLYVHVIYKNVQNVNK